MPYSLTAPVETEAQRSLRYMTHAAAELDLAADKLRKQASALVRMAESLRGAAKRGAEATGVVL